VGAFNDFFGKRGKKIFAAVTAGEKIHEKPPRNNNSGKFSALEDAPRGGGRKKTYKKKLAA